MPYDHQQSLRRLAKELSARADVDIRTATRALEVGVDAIHGGRVRESLDRAAHELGVQLPHRSSELKTA